MLFHTLYNLCTPRRLRPFSADVTRHQMVERRHPLQSGGGGGANSLHAKNQTGTSLRLPQHDLFHFCSVRGDGHWGFFFGLLPIYENKFRPSCPRDRLRLASRLQKSPNSGAAVALPPFGMRGRVLPPSPPARHGLRFALPEPRGCRVDARQPSINVQ